MTATALKSNIEWSTKTISKKDSNYTYEILKEFNQLWQESELINSSFIEKYSLSRKQIYSNNKTGSQPLSIVAENSTNYNTITKNITMNSMQQKAVQALDDLISYGENKALVIAATGTGKTFMSAFHVKNFKPKRLLFIVHREEILRKAQDTFKTILNLTHNQYGLLTGTTKELDAEYLFATINSIQNNLEYYTKDSFNYIIIDEAHHATAPSYTKVLEYFTPEFLLGMTATPERADNGNVYQVFDHNIALDIRLHEALEENLVVPFHYFGIKDINDIDLSAIDISDYQKLAKALMINRRTDFIIENMLFYGFNGTKRKCIGFCATIEHAQFMAKEFQVKGFHATYLTGEDTIPHRIKTIRDLEDPSHLLEFIFVVDIFNEGIDIPSVNLVLMLRPTESPIIFIQQLGRGLRNYDGKEFLTVIDFIGNHSKTFFIALALNGQKYYDKESLKMAVKTNFANIPGSTYIQIDEISKETILQQIDRENFNSMKYLKEEYQEFKKLLNGKIPYQLMNYLTIDGAPNPIKFIQYKTTYLQFIDYMEENHLYMDLLQEQEFLKLLNYLSNLLPIKRIHEFLCLQLLLTYSEITLTMVLEYSKKFITSIDLSTILHAFQTLSFKYYDSAEKKRFIPFVTLDGEILKRSEFFTNVLCNSKMRLVIEDLLNYGIYSYLNRFGTDNFGTPHLKLYEQYSMRDLALLSNYDKTHSSFRGSGLVKTGDHYFCFIDLHKEEKTEERLKYKDKFISSSLFQWQSPNNTKATGDRGLDLCFSNQRGKFIHLFVRKYKEIDSKTEPYIYIGEGIPQSSEGEKPITILYKLKNELPDELYYELTEIF